MTIDFLLEIGFEELPPSFLKVAAETLTKKLENLLKEKRIFYRSVRIIYSPRRFGALILGLSRKQKSRVIEVQGPPKKVAYDEKNAPTEMLKGFMRANNFRLEDIRIVKTGKGEYVCGKKEVSGEATENVLRNEVPKLIRGLEFPKTMRWNDSGDRFPRPIRWILALLDRKPIRFRFAGVEADRYTMPNIHFSFKPIRLEKPREYLNFLRHGGVIADPNERKRMIIRRIKEASRNLEGKLQLNEPMIEAINCTVEYPEGVAGEFETKYLELPEEVLLSVLQTQGNLIWIKPMNMFVCIFSARKKAFENVARGFTSVIAARLYDAYFYYQNDVKTGIAEMREQTKGMMWLGDLGSMFDKTERLSKLASVFEGSVKFDHKKLQRAAQLCKADLLSQMIREKDFTTLQGIMGGHYARIAGEDSGVYQAVRDHYLPRFVGDEIPSSIEGCLLSAIDKIDNIIGAFLSGNRPTGSYDPLAVRRNGYVVISLFDSYAENTNVLDAIKTLQKIYNRELDHELIRDFFNERLDRYLEDSGFRYDEVNSVLATWKGFVNDARMRCEALRELRDKPEFTKLVIGQKRVRNILKGVKKVAKLDVNLLNEKSELNLYNESTAIIKDIESSLGQKNYKEVLKILLSLRPHIDKFFDDVLVMCDDEKVKNNRLALLDYINKLFLEFADFSCIVIEGEKQEKL